MSELTLHVNGRAHIVALDDPDRLEDIGDVGAGTTQS